MSCAHASTATATASLYFLSALYCSALPPRWILLQICLWPRRQWSCWQVLLQLLAENYLSAGAPFDYDPEDAQRLEREQAPFRPFPPLWVRFLRVIGAALLVVLIQADWTQRKLRDYFLRPLARLTNRVSPRGYQTYDWEE